MERKTGLAFYLLSLALLVSVAIVAGCKERDNPADPGSVNYQTPTPGNQTVTPTPTGIPGQTWVLVTSNGPFGARSGHCTVVFNDKLFVISGYNDTVGDVTNDVWSSTDGLSWNLEISNAAFPKRMNAAATVLGSEMFLVGGKDGSTLYNDVWKSSDGVNWIEVTSSAEFSPRERHSLLGFEGDLVLIGGRSGGSLALNEVWGSSSGTSWTLRNSPTPGIDKIQRHTSVSFTSYIWTIGGDTDNENPSNALYYSNDTVDWLPASASGHFDSRYGHGSAVLSSKLWVVAGSSGGGVYFNDVWSSIDGINWTEVTSSASFSPRYRSTLTSFQGRLWLIGGYTAPGYLAEVWRSP